MAISPGGTYDYVAIVPARGTDDSFECVAEHRDGVDPERLMWLNALGGDDPAARLVGPAPRLRVSPGGLTPDAGPLRPWVMRSCFTLTASSRKNATVAAASFHVDAALTSRLLEGDVIYLARTSCGGLGLSAVRQDTLSLRLARSRQCRSGAPSLPRFRWTWSSAQLPCVTSATRRSRFQRCLWRSSRTTAAWSCYPAARRSAGTSILASSVPGRRARSGRVCCSVAW